MLTISRTVLCAVNQIVAMISLSEIDLVLDLHQMSFLLVFHSRRNRYTDFYDDNT